MEMVILVGWFKYDGSMGYGNFHMNGVISIIVKWFKWIVYTLGQLCAPCR